MKKFFLIVLALSAVMVVPGLADAKLTQIGTVTIDKEFLGIGNRGGGFSVDAPRPTSNEYALIYDDVQGIVWIDYTSGSMEWPDAVSWAAGLNESGALTSRFDPGVTVTWNGEWRLPKTVDGARKNGFDGTTTAGFNITSSEMGHLFYESLGNKGYYDTKGNEQKGFEGLKNKEPFQNLNAGLYWSGTQYAIYPNHAWHFNFFYGSQDFIAFTNSYSFPGLAVREATVVIK